jgi:hypothetical protein
MITKLSIAEFTEDDKIMMPKKVAAVIESLLKQGTVLPEIEECYDIVKAEHPSYKHTDNSNARKMLTGKVIVSQNGRAVRRKIHVTAVIRIIDKLGIASGKYIPTGRQLDFFKTVLNAQFDAKT